MKYIFLSFVILFSINGCEDNTHKIDKEKEALSKQRAKTLEEYKTTQKNKVAVEIKTPTKPQTPDTGIIVKDGTISIDTNKTKAFIKGLSDKLDMKIDDISNNLKKGIIKNKEAGIDISANGISIDLNKTKSVISSWSKKIESFVKTFDEPNDTNKTK